VTVALSIVNGAGQNLGVPSMKQKGATANVANNIGAV